MDDIQSLVRLCIIGEREKRKGYLIYQTDTFITLQIHLAELVRLQQVISYIIKKFPVLSIWA